MASRTTSFSFSFTKASSQTQPSPTLLPASTPEPAPETVTTTSSQSLDVTIAIGDPPLAGGPDGTVSATALGSATAIGESTLAIGDVEALSTIAPHADTAEASASFTALAVDTTGGQAFTTTSADAMITGDFDVVIAIASSETYTATAGDLSVHYESSSIDLTGIDIGGSGTTPAAETPTPSDASGSMISDGTNLAEPMDAPAIGLDAIDWTLDGPQPTDDQDHTACGQPDNEVDLDFDCFDFGNIAHLDFAAVAIGPDTFADVVFNVLSVEDQFSTVDAWAFSIASV